MKILKLKIYNLASLVAINNQAQEIDFTQAPLLHAGVMAITGPTGAGKSTLLDALCLALFNEVPRLRHLGAAKIDDQGKDLAIKDPRHLLSRGCGYGYASVEFAVGDHRYEAKWEVKRARQKPNGNLQPVERSIRDLATQQILSSQTSECAQLIPTLIGMDFEQFSRAVLLAQSEFSAFLKASDNERSLLLECLTNSDLYTKLGQAADRKRKAAKEAYEQLKQRHQWVAPMEAAEREALDAAIAELDRVRVQEKQQLDVLMQQQNWWQTKQHLQDACEQAQQAYAAQQAEWQAQAPAQQRWEEFQRLLPLKQLLHTQHTLQDQQHKHQHTWTSAQQHSNHAHQHLQQTAQHVQQMQEQRQAWRQQLSEQQVWLQQAQKLVQRRDVLREQYQAFAKQQQDLSAQETTLLTQIDALQQQHALNAHTAEDFAQNLTASVEWSVFDALAPSILPHAAQQALDARQRLQHHQLTHQQQQEQLKQLRKQEDEAAQQQPVQSEAMLQAQIHAINLQIQHTRDAQYQLQRRQLDDQALLGLYQQEQQADTEQQQLRQHLEQAQQQQQRAQQQWQQAKDSLAALQPLMEAQQQQPQHWIEQLRHHLHQDQPCLVCGSVIHDHQQWAIVDQQQREQAQHLAQQWQHAKTQLEHADQQLQHAHIHLERLHADHAQAISRLQQLTQTRRQQAGEISLATLHARLDETPHQQQQLQQQLDDLIAQQHTTQQHLEQQQQHAHTWQQVRQNLATCEQQMAQRDAYIQHLQAQYQFYVDQFWPQMTAEHQQQWQHDPKHWLDCLEPALRARRDSLAAQARWKIQAEQDQQALQHAQHQHQHLSQQRAMLTQHQQIIAQEGQTVVQALQQIWPHSLAPTQDVNVWQHYLDQQQQQHDQALESAQQQHHLAKDQWQQAQLAEQRAHDQHQQVQQQLDHQQQQIDAWHQQQTPDLSPEQIHEVLAQDEPTMQALGARLDALKQTWLECAAHHQHVTLQLEQHDHAPHATDQSMTDLQQLYQALQGRAQQTEYQWAQAYAKQQEDIKKQQDAEELTQAIHAAQAEYHRYDQLAAPIGCATGALFRRLAQGYQLDVLLQFANQQLSSLSPRYALKRAEQSLGLLVVDHEMADSVRSVYSLSGGESFLVSLALALGLSRMASHQVQIESLFIDEGFGTLDPESLQLVMDTLDQLHGQGRKVTVISHVQELHERIPVQIQVKRMGAGRSRLQVASAHQRQL